MGDEVQDRDATVEDRLAILETTVLKYGIRLAALEARSPGSYPGEPQNMYGAPGATTTTED